LLFQNPETEVICYFTTGGEKEGEVRPLSERRTEMEEDKQYAATPPPTQSPLRAMVEEEIMLRRSKSLGGSLTLGD